MANFKEIDVLLKNNEDLSTLDYSNSKMRNLMLDLLENKIDNFNYYSKSNYEYMLNIFEYFPYYFGRNFEHKKEFYIRIKSMINKIHTLLVEKPGNVNKSSNNFKFLKNLIDNLETISLSLLYNYGENYKGSKYEFINYLVFDVKRLCLFEDALKRFPYIVNYEDAKGCSLIDNVIEKYLSELDKYCENNKLNLIDNLIYYDEILKLLLKSEKLNFDMEKRNNWIKFIYKRIEYIDDLKFNSLTKQKYIFYLNDLCNLINNDFNSSLEYLEYKYDINCHFNQSINFECGRINNLNKNSNLKKLKDEVILTFDGEGAKEIDDALSIKILENGNYLLGIHIADPLFFVNNNSIIFDEAKRRTTSIYLSDLTIPMFPKIISSEKASLLEGKLTPATSYYYEISNSGEIKTLPFYKSNISVYKNMSYNDFNEILEHGYEDKAIEKSIFNFSNVQQIISKLYKTDFYYDKFNRKDSNITSTNITGNTLSEKVIESTMVLNNYMVSKYFLENNLPFIYRVHAVDKITQKKIDDFSKSINMDEPNSKYLKYIDVIKNIYPQAFYSIKNEGHFGLGLEAYSHITSPLRRFADILANICLNKFYFNEYNDNDIYMVEQMLNTEIPKINQKKLAIDVFSSNYEKSKI